MLRYLLVSFAVVVAGLGVISAYLFIALDTHDTGCAQTLEQAQFKGHFGQSWIPEFVPRDASDVCWETDAETGSLVLFYRFRETPIVNRDARTIPVPKESDVPSLPSAGFPYADVARAYSIESFTVLVSDSNRSALLWDYNLPPVRTQ